MSEDKKPAATTPPPAAGTSGQTASGFAGTKIGQALNNLSIGFLKTLKEPFKEVSKEDQAICQALAEERRAIALKVRALADKTKQGSLPVPEAEYREACESLKAFDAKVADMRAKYGDKPRPWCLNGDVPPSSAGASKGTLRNLALKQGGTYGGVKGGTLGKVYSDSFDGNAVIDFVTQSPDGGLGAAAMNATGIPAAIARATKDLPPMPSVPLRGRSPAAAKQKTTSPQPAAGKPAGTGTVVQAPPAPVAQPNQMGCPCDGAPVNPIYGAKVLVGDLDLDFVLDGPLPLAWRRTYISCNADSGWLGQGWTLPFSLRLDLEDKAVVFVDEQGRRTPFARLDIGGAHYSHYERTTLRRTGEYEYEVLTPENIRLLFGRLGEQENPERLLLYRLVDPNGNAINLTWSRDGLPCNLIDSTGRRIGFRFDGQRLNEVLELHGEPDKQGRYLSSQLTLMVRYRYSPEGDLISVADASGEVVRTFAYQNHMMVEHAEPGGVVSQYQWDRLQPGGRVTRNSLNTGEFWTFAYDGAARQTTVTDASGRKKIYHFNADMRHIGTTDASGGFTERLLDLYGQLSAEIDPAGNALHYGRDEHGNIKRVTDANGASTNIEYHPRWRKPVNVTDAMGRTTRYAYDERGNLIERIDPDGAITRYQVNQQGLPVVITDARGGVVRLDYDEACRLVRYTDCSGKATRYAYDQRGNLAHVTDAAGWRTEYSYEYINRQDRLVAVKHPSTGEERFAYDSLGRVIAHHDALGNVTRYALDVAGRPTQRKNALGHSLRYGYDVHGRLITLHNENNIPTRFAYDALDRLTAEQGFDGRRIDYRYNKAGDLIESTDSPNTPYPIRTRYKRDKVGRLQAKIGLKRQDIAGQTRFITARHRFEYNHAGQMIGARNPAARIELLYDQAGQLLKEITETRDKQRTILEHHYDLLGSRIQTILPDGRKLNLLTYGSGHVHQINLDGTAISDIERDDIHQEVKRSQGALESRYDRDGLGRLLSSHAYQAGQGNPFMHGADRAGPTAGNVPNGTRINRRYEYDSAGQLEHILDGLHGRIQYQYDPLGRLLAARQVNLTENFAFDPAHNLLDPEQAQAAARPKKTSFSQEEWAALVKANMDNPKFNPLQALDKYNNPDTWNGVKANQIKVYEDKRYAYDDYGNTVEKKIGAHTVQQFLWDAEHQLIQATVTRNGSTQVFRYDYDPFGRRIAKRDAFGTTHFTWDGNRILLEKRNDHQRLYIYEPDSFVPLAQVSLHQPAELPPEYEYIPQVPVAWIGMMNMYPKEWKRRMKMEGLTPAQLWQEEDDRRRAAWQKREDEREAIRRQANFSVYYYHTDHLGTPRELTDSQGGIRWAASYKAWGNTLRVAMDEPDPKTGPIEQAIRFQGQYCDSETGLHYNRFRYYDPDIGRFASQDPIGLLGGENLYRYAPNPTDWIDPLGLDPCDKSVRALQEGPNGTMVDVETKQQADELLKKAFPGYRKVAGIGSQDAQGLRKKRKIDAAKKPGTYHKDYPINPDTERVYGHDGKNPHGECPHINIKRTDGKKVVINIRGRKK